MEYSVANGCQCLTDSGFDDTASDCECSTEFHDWDDSKTPRVCTL